MKIEERPIDSVRFYDKNPRKNDGAVEAVANSIREFGFKVPIVIDSKGVIVCGHTRVKAARALGLATVPCIIADDLTPEQVKSDLTGEQYRLYRLIWGRFTACQMANSVYDNVVVDVESNGYIFRANYSELKFPGYTAVYEESKDEESDELRSKLPELTPVESDSHGVARLYTLPGAMGRVGLISPLSKHFCHECNRLRLTADGCLKPCLHSAEEISVRGLHGEELKEAICTAVSHKPRMHVELSPTEHSRSKRSMYRIGG